MSGLGLEQCKSAWRDQPVSGPPRGAATAARRTLADSVSSHQFSEGRLLCRQVGVEMSTGRGVRVGSNGNGNSMAWGMLSSTQWDL